MEEIANTLIAKLGPVGGINETTKKTTEDRLKSPVKQVLGDRILLLLDEAPEELQGGLVIASSYKEKQPQGIILSVGNKVESVKVGDHIRFSNHAGVPVEIEKVVYQLIKEADVHYIIED